MAVWLAVRGLLRARGSVESVLFAQSRGRGTGNVVWYSVAAQEVH